MLRIFLWNLLRSFSLEIEDENLQKNSPKIRRIFRRSLTKNSQELRSGRLRHNIVHETIAPIICTRIVCSVAVVSFP